MPQPDEPLHGRTYTRMYNAEQGVILESTDPDPSFTIRSARIEELTDEKRQLIAYLESKVRARNDWHAVQDAASDIREIDAKLEELAR